MDISKRFSKAEFSAYAMGAEQIQDYWQSKELSMVEELSESASRPVCTLKVWF
jgi:hypothetical protein